MAAAESDLSSEMEVDAFRRLFPLLFHERHLVESIRPDGRRLGKARDTTIALGAVTSANGSALTKMGCTTMLAAIKLEVMTPKFESPDEGCIAVDFHMPPICSPFVRPGRPADAAHVVAKQLSDAITSSGMIDLKELCLVSGKAVWMAYLDIYCLDADGSLFDAALLSAVAAFSHLQIPVVSLSDEGRIVLVPEDNGEGKMDKEPVNKEKRKLKLCTIPFSLTCILHKNYILVDPTAEEESIMDTQLTVVLDSSELLVSFYKPGGSVLAHTSAMQDCVALARKRMKEVQTILNEAISDMEALEGKYVEPGLGGDPIRNPKVLPTGKNIHALDPQAIPTSAAMQSAKVVERLTEREKADNGGRYPETVALVLWGTDNIKTYGESLAQVLWMIGVRPVADTFGRVNRVEPVSLEELGRPRIDVVVNCYGVFRDLFINQMNLLDRAVKMVAELDEPEDPNCVRKHSKEQAKELGIDIRKAATRVFSNASGSCSSNVNLAVENSSWNDEKQLQEIYLGRKSFAFDCDAPGTGMTEKRKVFEMALSTADATFQNLDSFEILLTDVSHYFDSDPTNLVQNLRKDGKKPNAYIADTTAANAQVRTLSESVRLDARTKLLNPKWCEGMLSSGYESVCEIEKRLTNTVGWSATSGQVGNWVYEEANTTFIQDQEMLNRLMGTNPNSFRKLVQTSLEANGRGCWETSEENIDRLRQLYSEVEIRLRELIGISQAKEMVLDCI